MIRKIIVLMFVICIAQSSSAANDDTYRGLSNLTKVLDLIENNYVEDVDSNELTTAAINGMLKTLDPYSIYLPPDQFSELEIETIGEFGGIGIEVTLKNGKLTVISAIEDTPASEAGIKSGDIIVSIDGKETKNINSVEAVKLLRGPIGSNVVIGIFTPSENVTRDVSLKREKIKVSSIKSKLIEGNIGYIKISQFQKNSGEDFLKSYRVLDSKSGKKMKGLVIDLRNNPGGLLDQAVEIADDFIKNELIVSVKGRNYDQSSNYYANGETLIDTNTVVIVNRGSASASEVLAGALQDNNVAEIVGQKTFGKGSVQAIIELDDGSGVKLTTAKFFTPNGSVINNVGIKPDYLVENKDDKDLQLDRAIDILKNK